MATLKAIFFLLIFLTIYSFIVYPLILRFLSLFLKKEKTPSELSSSVTLIVSAFNEEETIDKKIRNCLALEYPKEQMEILVVSDHSTDKTDEIVRSYLKDGIGLLSLPSRMGKTAGLNEAVKRANGQILVFSDADSIYPPDTIRKMVATLNNSGIGLVTGTTRYFSSGDQELSETSGLYTKIEKMIKRQESAIGSCVGADGAIFAMRKSLYQILQNDDINDLVIPLNVVRQGHRVVLCDDLYCLEASSSNTEKEFHRQVRITNRTLRALYRHKDLMNFLRYPLFSFELISHKLVRLSVPLFLAVLIPVNLILLKEGAFYSYMLAGQFLFYIGAFIGYRQARKGGNSFICGFIYHFVLVNSSIFMGWLKFLSGQNQATWNA